MSEKKDEWKLVTDYSISVYQCGLHAGDQIELRKDLSVTQADRVMNVIRAGEVYVVLKGTADAPGVVWMRDSAGARMTWDDDSKIFDFFKKKQEETS